MREHRMSGHATLPAACVVLLALTYGLAMVSAPPTTGPRDDRGRAVFIQKGCANCHAIYGRGVGGVKPEGGPDLGERRVYDTYLGLAADLWNHMPKMLENMDKQGIEPPDFTEQDVNQIIRYLSFIRFMDQPGNWRTGRRLLASKKCTQCHGVGGGSDLPGPELTARREYLAPLDLATALWNHGPQMERLFEERDIDRPRFGRHDLVDLVAGLRSYITTNVVPPEAYDPGDQERGAVLVLEKGCTQCHAVRGAGGDLAPDFDDLDFRKTVTEIAGDMWNHGPEMWDIMSERGMSFPALTRSDMADLIAYLYSLDMADPPGDPDRGRRLVADKRCATCHSVSGVGGDLAGDLVEFGGFDSPTGMVSAMWNHASDMVDYSKQQRVRWPELSGRDIADIFSFVRSH